MNKTKSLVVLKPILAFRINSFIGYQILFVLLSFVLTGVVHAQSSQSYEPFSTLGNGWNGAKIIGTIEGNELLTASYDKFSDQTTVTGQSHLADCINNTTTPAAHFDIAASYTFQGLTPRVPEKVNFIIQSPLRRFETNPEAIVIVDGKRIVLGTMLVQTKSYAVYDTVFYYQLLVLPIPYATLKTLANASAVEMKIGDLELALPNIDVKKLQQIIPMFKKLIAPLEKPTPLPMPVRPTVKN